MELWPGQWPHLVRPVYCCGWCWVQPCLPPAQPWHRLEQRHQLGGRIGRRQFLAVAADQLVESLAEFFRRGDAGLGQHRSHLLGVRIFAARLIGLAGEREAGGGFGRHDGISECGVRNWKIPKVGPSDLRYRFRIFLKSMISCGKFGSVQNPCAAALQGFVRKQPCAACRRGSYRCL